MCLNRVRVQIGRFVWRDPHLTSWMLANWSIHSSPSRGQLTMKQPAPVVLRRCPPRLRCQLQFISIAEPTWISHIPSVTVTNTTNNWKSFMFKHGRTTLILLCSPISLHYSRAGLKSVNVRHRLDREMLITTHTHVHTQANISIHSCTALIAYHAYTAPNMHVISSVFAHWK